MADGPHAYLSGGYAFEGRNGWEVEVGAQADWKDRIYVRASPASVVIFDGDPAVGFYRDTFSNGQSRCRNSSNGQFAADEKCEGEIDSEWRGLVEGQVRLSRSVLIGGGGLYTFQSDDPAREKKWAGYASLTWEANQHLGLQLRAGGDYASVQARVTF